MTDSRSFLKRYPVDNSAILHLAVLQPGKANIFRFCADLTEEVDPDALQKAVDVLTPQFPLLVAGIRSDLWRYYVVPVEESPKVEPDRATIAYMDMEQIRRCAMRVLYRRHQISVEFFHSLTDGYGALIYLRRLVAEYFRFARGIHCSEEELQRTAPRYAEEAEAEDGFLTHVGDKTGPRNNTPAFQPGEGELIERVNITTGKFSTREILDAAHRYGISMTTFLAAVMMESLRELQAKKNIRRKTIQLMVPVNMRNLFPCRTLHNFSLYATPGIDPDKLGEDFENVAQKVDAQLKKQFDRDYLQAMLTTNVKLDRNPLIVWLPLAVRCFCLKLAYRFFGGRTSCMSLSNLGRVQFPKEIEPYITGVAVHMSPRISSAYNCGVISHGEKLYINFSRCMAQPELEVLFFKKLQEHGCTCEVETDDADGDFSALGYPVEMMAP